MNAPSHLQTDRTRQHQGLSYDKVEVSNVSCLAVWRMSRCSESSILDRKEEAAED